MNNKEILDSFKRKYPKFFIFEDSLQKFGKKYFFLIKKENEKYLVIGEKEFKFLLITQNTVNLLCKNFQWLNPKVCGLKNSFGFGDRIGLATPGHIKALKNYNFFPILAQQSVRELERTGRKFRDVLNSAILGCFQQGYKNGFGADADHVKKISDLEKAVNSGFTFFTIDLSEKIQNSKFKIENKKESIQVGKYEKFYFEKKYKFGKYIFEFTSEEIKKLVFIYGEAIDFIEKCYRFLKSKIPSFDFEISIDETSIPTTPFAHVFIVEELQRRKIEFQNLALKLPGRFEKGIDYKGNLDVLKKILEIHQKIREKLGSYKISLHSGSDKFKIYPILKNILGDNFHIKTSGTSWICAVKTIAEIDFYFFLEILKCGIKNFKENSLSYEISAKPNFISIKKLKDKKTNEIFNDKNIRQIIHISYGSIFSEKKYRDTFYKILKEKEEKYHQELKQHLEKHLKLLS